MSLFSVPPLISAVLVLAIGLLVVSRNPRAEVNRAFGGFSFSIFLWLGCYSLVYSSTDPVRALFWSRNSYFGVVFIPVTVYHFAVSYLEHRADRRWLGPAFALACGFLVLSRTPWFFRDVRHFFWGYYPQVGRFYHPFIAFFSLLFARSLWLLFAAVRRGDSNPVRALQTKYVFLAFFISVFASVDYLGKYGLPVYPFGYLNIFIFVALLAHTIIRHHLLDIKVAITRTGLFLATYLVVLGLPALVGWRGRPWLEAAFHDGWWMVPLSLCMLLAMVGPLVYGYLRRQTEQLLRRELAQASTDALTGALTRRAFLQAAASRFTDDAGANRPWAVLMLDLDHFKETNDTHGHLAGDAVLQEVASRLSRTLRTRDLLGRYGGEEFILLLPEADAEQALMIAERLRLAVGATPIRAGVTSLTQTLSIGLATCPEDGATLEALIGRADQALYAAKRAGRNRTVRT